jgi:hypothetical protein
VAADFRPEGVGIECTKNGAVEEAQKKRNARFGRPAW